MIQNIIISFSSNDWYAEHLAVAIYSLLKHLSEWYFAKIFILDGWISEKNKKLITSLWARFNNGEIEFILMDRSKYGWRNTKGLSQETYYRLELPELLPEYEKILYLDVDIIVRGDISQLYNIDISSNSIWAVREITTINYYADLYNIKSPFWLFFNAWVLMMNLKKLREINLKKSVLDFINTYNEKLIAYDQDALNVILIQNWTSLHPKYNALPFLRATKKGNVLKYSDNEFKDAKKFPVIVHFAGEKPRKKNCFHPLSYLYHQYRSEVWLPPVNLDWPLKWTAFLKQLLSKFTLYLQANLPNRIYRRLIYKPYGLLRFLSKKSH